jgi:hypothetical protein
MKDNLYWAVYKNLEKELLELSYQIHIDDKQLDVYSVKIAELLLRCSVEIESIAKDLYEQEGGNMNPIGDDKKPRDLYFDTDCMNLIEEKWALSKKKVFVVGTSFYVQDDKNKTLSPLHKANKRGTSGSKWKQAYMAVKHERSKRLSEGNIGNLINAMAALFLLNVYYRDEKYDLGAGIVKKTFATNLGSDIFSIKSHVAHQIWNDSVANILSDECAYIEKWDDKEAQEFERIANEANKNLTNALINNNLVSKRLQEIVTTPELTAEYNSKKSLNVNAIAIEVLGSQSFGNIASSFYAPVSHKIQQMKSEAILNKVKSSNVVIVAQSPA